MGSSTENSSYKVRQYVYHTCTSWYASTCLLRWLVSGVSDDICVLLGDSPPATPHFRPPFPPPLPSAPLSPRATLWTPSVCLEVLPVAQQQRWLPTSALQPWAQTQGWGERGGGCASQEGLASRACVAGDQAGRSGAWPCAGKASVWLPTNVLKLWGEGSRRGKLK